MVERVLSMWSLCLVCAQPWFNPQSTHILTQRIKISSAMTRIGILELNLLLFARKESFPKIPSVSMKVYSWSDICSQLDLIPPHTHTLLLPPKPQLIITQPSAEGSFLGPELAKALSRGRWGSSDPRLGPFWNGSGL